jgi:hypothetical protein
VQPFSALLTAANGLLGIADKGMNSAQERRLVTPYKLPQINKAVRAEHTPSARKEKSSWYTGFNMEVGRIRVLNENIIGDLTRWAAARGNSSKTTFDDIDHAQRRIRLSHALTNFIYRFRRLG